MDSIEKNGVVTKKNKKQNDGKETQEKNGEWKFRSLYLGGGHHFFLRNLDDFLIFLFLFKKKTLFFVVLVLQKLSV